MFDFPQSTPLTFVLDRGIYGLDTFKQFLTDECKNHFISWEKGFRADRHKNIEWNGSISLYRAKNSSQDLKRYHFSYCDTRWSRDENIRCLLVKATNPKGNSITVSILASDVHRCAKDIIALMFDRWIQENDFKTLDVHFGINEITSYATLSYNDIEQTLTDKQEKNGVYKALEKQRAQLKAQLKTQLLNEHRAKNSRSQRQEKIASLTQQLNELEEKMVHTEKEVSRLQALIEQGFRKLDTGNKSILDGVKILARNSFYMYLRPFIQAYNNYRDDHMLFRHLTRAPGLVRDRGDCVEVLLIPQACFSPKVTTIFNAILEKINHSQPCMPDGSGRKIIIRLLQNNKTLFDVTSVPEPERTSKKEPLAIEHLNNRRLQPSENQPA